MTQLTAARPAQAPSYDNSEVCRRTFQKNIHSRRRKATFDTTVAVSFFFDILCYSMHDLLEVLPGSEVS